MTSLDVEKIAGILEQKAAELRQLAASLPTTTPPREKPEQFALVPDPPAKRKRTPAEGNLFQSALTAFGEMWRARYKERYIVSPADRAQLGRLLRQIGDEADALPALFMRYLADTDEFVVRQGHTLKYFVASFNRYRAAPAADRRQLL